MTENRKEQLTQWGGGRDAFAIEKIVEGSKRNLGKTCKGEFVHGKEGETTFPEGRLLFAKKKRGATNWCQKPRKEQGEMTMGQKPTVLKRKDKNQMKMGNIPSTLEGRKRSQINRGGGGKLDWGQNAKGGGLPQSIKIDQPAVCLDSRESLVFPTKLGSSRKGERKH